MKTKWIGLTFCLLASAPPLWAGEDVQLDRNFSFRLTQPELQPPPAPAPAVPVRPEHRLGPPLKTPLREPLPPGSRAFKFNGQTYYYIPL